MNSRSRSSWRWLLTLALGAATLALMVAWVAVLVAEADGSSSSRNQNAFGHLTALLVLLMFTATVGLIGRTPGAAASDTGGMVATLQALILGKDNRVSTSKFQVLVWTYAIAFALLSLVGATWVGPDTGFDELTDPDFDFEPYLVLLGGPFAAAVLARAVVGDQVASGQAIKPPGEPSPEQVVTNDQGDADLVDAQYLLFNIIALVYFLGAFMESPTSGLPDIPTILYVLTGASAAGYVANKAIPTGAPTITSLVPEKGPHGTEIEIFGRGLLFPKQEGAVVENGSEDAFHTSRVMIGGLRAQLVAERLTHLKSGDDRLRAIVPTLPPGRHDVRVLNFRGTANEPKQFEVTP